MPNEAKHTPEPRWVARPMDHNPRAGRWGVYPPHPSGDGSFYAPVLENLDEATAQLIANAPDTLKAFKKALEWIENLNDLSVNLDIAEAGDREPHIEAMRKAIANATKVQP